MLLPMEKDLFIVCIMVNTFQHLAKVWLTSITRNRQKEFLRTVYQNHLEPFRVEKYDKPPDGVKQVNKEEISHNTEKVLISDNIQRWIDRISDLNGLAKDATDRKDVLSKELSDVEKEIQDCLHYIEFTNLNAAQGYKAYKILKDRRVKRRSIKNELQVLGIILGKKISETATDEIMKCIEGLDNRQYAPRVLQELFDL